MLREAFMAATVLLLLTLVVVTPSLVGPREDISTLPRLILNYDAETLVAFVTSLSGTYLYDALFLNVTPLSEGEPIQRNASRTHALEGRIPLDRMPAFTLEAVAQDGAGQLFDLQLEILGIEGPQGWTFRIRTDPSGLTREFTDQDLVNNPFATLMDRRETA